MKMIKLFSKCMFYIAMILLIIMHIITVVALSSALGGAGGVVLGLIIITIPVLPEIAYICFLAMWGYSVIPYTVGMLALIGMLWFFGKMIED